MSSSSTSKATRRGHAKSAEQKRSKWLKLRVTPAEYELVRRAAEACGLSVSDYVRTRSLKYHLKDAPKRGEVIRELARITSNLNQLARESVQQPAFMDSVAVISHIIVVAREIHIALERHP